MTDLKRCPACDEWLDKSSFWKSRARSDGLECYCKNCFKEGRRENDENKFRNRINFHAGMIASTLSNIEGEVLPSERCHASILDMHRITYRETCQVLQFLGYIKVMHGQRRVLLKPIDIPLKIIGD